MAEVVVIGGTGQIGAKVVARLQGLGHGVRAASPRTGVDTLSGDGLREALDGARVVIDVSKPHSYDPRSVPEFFRTATTNVLRAEERAGVEHHVALGIVGSERPHDIPFYRAKDAGEQLVRDSGVPYTLVHATQFFEFALGIAASAETEGVITLPDAFVQPAAGADVADAVTGVALGEPLRAVTEIAGPVRMPLAGFVSRVLRARGDARTVRSAASGRYFGGHLDQGTLLPGENARLLPTHLEAWLAQN
ncbi:SDR family oxidoreductase [Microbacterium sp. KUDC0406]|uniref:SDR family oxidoreductase n=1 Tax=Microbacterium sp. KUDC0406 TaxID=2909588 RepID=UPI001F336C73|nr:SDR family oxidoreductase [Microbacterium sp. KUDC0406]UJP10209.1 SDR family oxidoreductase [Microbacterium sp. KUDC0406]